MAKRTVKAALWRYTDVDGGRRIARFGDEIEISKAEAERGERLNVFSPAPAPEVVPSALERALAGITQRTPEPAGGDDLPLPPHDVQPVVEAEPVVVEVFEVSELVTDVELEAAPVVEAEPVVVELKRPAKTAAIEKWVDYVHKATGRPVDELSKLSKDELQAIGV